MDNPGKVREHRRKAYELNKEKVKERSRAWSASNKERKAEASRAWALANPQKVLNSRVKKFGLTASDYLELLRQQDGKCAICGTNEPKGRGRLRVDHCHAAEKDGALVVRGLLCTKCNVGLGAFGDDIEVISRAIGYLDKARGRG